jgi:Bacterial PH domain
MYGSPSRTVTDELVKVGAENDWTAAQVAQYPIGSADSVPSIRSGTTRSTRSPAAAHAGRIRADCQERRALSRALGRDTIIGSEVAPMVSDAPIHDFTLHYSWPWKLFAPLLLVLGVSLPLLTRYVEWKQLGPGVWIISGLFLLLAAGSANYFSRVISVSRDTVEFRNAFGKTSLPWDQIVRIELANDEFRLVTTSGKRQSVNMYMINATLFARELDSRFGAGGLRLPA